MKPLALFLIGLVFGGGIGIVAGMGLEAPEHIHDDSHAHTAEELAAAGLDPDGLIVYEEGDICFGPPVSADHAMDHGTHGEVLDVSSEGPLPTVALELVPVAGGYSLHIITANYTFAPAEVDNAHTPGAGHAHVYADGVKILRALGPWVDLPGLAPGTEIRVDLTANTHETLADGETPIAATIVTPDP